MTGFHSADVPSGGVTEFVNKSVTQAIWKWASILSEGNSRAKKWLNVRFDIQLFWKAREARQEGGELRVGIEMSCYGTKDMKILEQLLYKHDTKDWHRKREKLKEAGSQRSKRFASINTGIRWVVEFWPRAKWCERKKKENWMNSLPLMKRLLCR